MRPVERLLAAARPLAEMARGDLAGRRWDAVVVGAGHNGLAAAAYLAGAGRSVLVLERRDRVGGAATVEEPWPGYQVSPCAYVVGLLDEGVVDDLRLRRRGYHVSLFDPQMYVPLGDGGRLMEWRSDERTLDDLRGWAPTAVEGFAALSRFEESIRRRLRGVDDGDDLWRRIEPPDRDEVAARLGSVDAVQAVFCDSIVDHLRRFVDDDRVVDALCAQGTIGSTASPLDPGTAWLHLHHSLGSVDGEGGSWGYVRGGIGMVSAALAEAAVDAGAVIVTGAPVVRIDPGRGVELDGGHRITSRVVLGNADAARIARLLPEDGAGLADLAAGLPMVGAAAKVNFALTSPPAFRHPEGAGAIVNVGGGVDRLQRGALAARRGELPEPLWAELYLPTSQDDAVAPAGRHIMSCFVQYVPYTLNGGWDDAARRRVADIVAATIEEHAPGFASLVEHVEVSVPPDIEAKVGLTGGHIFQGECLPDHMWDRRLPYRTEVEGVYLCGADTHPGGGVVGTNGRNAAMAVLADLG